MQRAGFNEFGTVNRLEPDAFGVAECVGGVGALVIDGTVLDDVCQVRQAAQVDSERKGTVPAPVHREDGDRTRPAVRWLPASTSRGVSFGAGSGDTRCPPDAPCCQQSADVVLPPGRIDSHRSGVGRVDDSVVGERHGMDHRSLGEWGDTVARYQLRDEQSAVAAATTGTDLVQ